MIACVTIGRIVRDAMLNIRLPAELKEALRQAAEDDHSRSLSGMVVRILDEWLAEHGYSSGPSPITANRRPAVHRTVKDGG